MRCACQLRRSARKAWRALSETSSLRSLSGARERMLLFERSTTCPRGVGVGEGVGAEGGLGVSMSGWVSVGVWGAG